VKRATLFPRMYALVRTVGHTSVIFDVHYQPHAKDGNSTSCRKTVVLATQGYI
jgi:hypothetical protein